MFFSGQIWAAVILQYHHVSDTLPAVTSISAHDFEQHLKYLKENNFVVVPLPYLIKELKQGNPLSANTVAITFDDGYKNNYTAAAPILEKFGFPYTIFVNPKIIDENKSYVMNWQQLRELSKKGATIANHSAQHDYLHLRAPNESQAQWHDRIKQDLLHSELRIKQETGQSLRYLAYPYGEFNQELQDILVKLDFIGIGQHSGALGIHNDFTRLPRFPASGVYANLDSLKTKLNSLPFHIVSLKHQDPVTGTNPPSLIIEFNLEDFHKSNFACYVSGQSKAKLNWLTATHVQITALQPLNTGRSRYNCTAPSIKNKGHFYWFSQPWIIQ